MTTRFEDVIAWQKARVFINHVYRITKGFPAEERFGLTSQFQRAAVSIAANIAEGYKRVGKDDKLRFLNYSQGSLEECRCYIYLANDFEYITYDEANQLINEIEETSKVLNGYMNTIANRKKWEDEV
ncbi:MAG: four helix bundle protein [Bacteroidales bacterium]|nr:four helix bundle protein [Bacteroidales bacterium]